MDYATRLHDVVNLVRTVETYPQFIGGQVWNWTDSLGGQYGLTGQDFIAQTIANYTGRFGSWPCGALSIHTYGSSADPLTDAVHDKAALDAAYDYATSIGRQLWLTEFGAPDSVPGVELWADGAPAKAYLDGMLPYLTTNGKVALWFLFQSGRDATDLNPHSIHLYDLNGNLTVAGLRYKQWATRCDGNKGDVVVSTTRYTPQDCRVTVTMPFEEPFVLPIDSIHFAAPQPDVTVQLDTGLYISGAHVWQIGDPRRNSVHFDMHRSDPNQAMTQSFTVYRACGEWPAFAGMGPG